MTSDPIRLEEELKIAAIADLHIGDDWSHYPIYVEELWRIREVLGALFLLGDTIELRYPSQGEEESWRRFYEVRDELEAMGLLQKTILLRGNHDASIDRQLWRAGFTVRDSGCLWCGTNDVYLAHGNGLGLEKAIELNGGIRDTRALVLLKKQLVKKSHPLLDGLRWVDWLITGHFGIPVCDPHAQVCGASSALGDPRHGTKRRYVLIDPHTKNLERQVMLRVVKH